MGGVFLWLFCANTKRNIQLKIGFIVSAIAVSLPVTGYLFNAFGESNDRWFFAIHFLFLIIFAGFVEEIKEVVLVYSNETIHFSRKRLLAIGYILIFANIIFNLWFAFTSRGTNWKEEFIPINSVSKYTENPCADSDTIMYDKSLYRVSTDSLTQINGRPENIAMLNDYYGLTYWFSMVNSVTQRYVDMSNEKRMDWRSFGFDQNIYTEAMAGCKYYLASDKTDREKKGYILKETINFNSETWYVYENPYYLGMAYLCESEVKEYEQDKSSLEQYNERLWKQSSAKELMNTAYDNLQNVFTCDVSIKDNTRLIIALPYCDKWEIYVDGMKIIPEKFNMYFSVLLESGNHFVEMRYSRKDNIISGIVSLLCVGVLISKYACNKRRKFDYEQNQRQNQR